MEQLTEYAVSAGTALEDLRSRILGLGLASACDATLHGIEHILDAMAEEFPQLGPTHPGRPCLDHGPDLSKKRQRQVRDQGLRIERSTEKLREQGNAKMSGRICNLWFVRVCLSPPGVVPRTLAQWCRNFSEQETRNISQSYVGDVLDGFVEVVKELNKADLSKLVAVAACFANCAESKPIYLKHVHDEASMRVKSYLHASGASASSQNPLRGRSSKVQNHVMNVHVGQTTKEMFTELMALHRKCADTIAVSLISVAQDAVSVVLQGIREADGATKIARVIHIIVGDSINTNDAACRRVAQYFLSKAAELGIRYSLVVILCASHLANLVVQIAICGQAMSNPIDEHLLCGTCSRLFKYLIPDYLEEFTFNLRDRIARGFALVHNNADAELDRHASHLLQALYGESVLPGALLKLLNLNVRSLQHSCPVGTDRDAICSQLFHFLTRLVLKCESKPIVTRFWLFADCVFTLLLVDLLKLGPTIFKVHSTKPRQDSIKRIRLVASFFDAAETPAQLRKAATCLQLTQHAVNMTAQTRAREDDPRPLILRLAQGEVQQHTWMHLKRLVPLLAIDPDIDVQDTLVALFVTETHLIIRFDIYAGYPLKLWRICKVLNPLGWLTSIQEFLAMEGSSLDVWFSFQLQQQAMSAGSLVDAVEFLMSEGVQDEVLGMLTQAVANSLDVERKHNQDKASESVKTKGMARFSRASILRRYGVQREKYLEQSMNASKVAKQVKYMNVWALANQRNPNLLPRPHGKLRQQSDVSASERRAVVHEGDLPALKSIVEAERESLDREVKRIKSDAAQALQRVSSGILPYTNRQWLDWLEGNEAKIRRSLKESCSARKVLSRRLAPESALPAVSRIKPQVGQRVLPEWESKLIRSKPGFACLSWGAGLHEKVVFFFCTLKGEGRALLMKRLSGPRFELDLSAHSWADAFLTYSALSKRWRAPGADPSVEVSSLSVKLAEYPTELRKLLKPMNPTSWELAADQFLDVADEDIADKYTLALHRKALSKGHRADAVTYIASQSVQLEILNYLQQGRLIFTITGMGPLVPSQTPRCRTKLDADKSDEFSEDLEASPPRFGVGQRGVRPRVCSRERG